MPTKMQWTTWCPVFLPSELRAHIRHKKRRGDILFFVPQGVPFQRYWLCSHSSSPSLSVPLPSLCAAWIVASDRIDNPVPGDPAGELFG
mmetsp:Transcript_26281/g.43601  ORF Transcript_26281/g.43601 Transcript_26281/m.43601 type:complete len:89 (+) Transcript_26281:244-510(+)